MQSENLAYFCKEVLAEVENRHQIAVCWRVSSIQYEAMHIHTSAYRRTHGH